MKKTIIHILSLACLSAMLLSGCNSKHNEIDTGIIHNPNSAQGYNDKEHIPVLAFDKNMHDFGNLSQGENISYSFKFTNKGNADLVIQNCEATCGCTVADFPREKIAPGETGYVTVSFNSAGKVGQQLQEVTVVSNAQPSRTKIRIQARVK
ncbi:MAG: DUF1573 domain-containing protein [Bacteroidales bacterium]|nr:DUF1573 domain-containing protein [Bacteroidales bacterium]